MGGVGRMKRKILASVVEVAGGVRYLRKTQAMWEGVGGAYLRKTHPIVVNLQRVGVEQMHIQQV